jgi:hypothetical protein
VQSISRSATIWVTLSADWTRPTTCRIRARITTGRNRSSTRGQTTRFAIPVSSSSVTKTTPLAEPGRWHRMGFQRQADGLIVGDHMLRQPHGGQLGIGLGAEFVAVGGLEQGQGIIIGKTAHCP